MNTDAEIIAEELAQTCEHGVKIALTACTVCEEELRPRESLAQCSECGSEYHCNRKKNRCCTGCRHRLVIH
jgi:hypothetical protein